MTAESQTKQTSITVYTPESQLRSPRKLFRAMWRDLLASRELAWRLLVRDISARYRQSLLGFLWAFLPPLATAAVFIFLKRGGVLEPGKTEIPYAAFVFIGTVLWQTFTGSLNAPIKAVTANKAMLAKINFPREALVLSAAGQVLFDFCIRVIIIAGIFIIYRIPLTWGLLAAPLAVIMLIMLGIFIGLILTPVSVLYTDVTQGLSLITMLWFFITPVVFTPPSSGFLSLVTKINPVSPILTGARDLATLGTLQDVVPFGIVSAITIVGLLVMWVAYRVSLPILIERMSA